jgi:spore germination cell wall hydrolase CwlJ-like protein
MFIPEVGSSTHYFANYVRPRWAGRMVKMASIGDHHFFRTKKGGWK